MRRRLAELVTVFLGVVLAFLAEDYRERLSDGRSEQAILSGVRTDFERNARQLSAQITHNRRVETGGTSLLKVLTESDEATVSVHDTLLMSVAIGVTPYTPVRGSVDALLNSGELRLLRNHGLRTALAEWPAALSDTKESQQRAIDAVDDHLLPLLVRTDVRLERAIQHYDAWNRGELPAEARSWVTVLPNTDQVRAVVALRVRRQSIARGYLERLAGLEDRIAELLGEDP